jgi:hypothetical protein
MRIVFIGNFDHSFCTEVHHKKTFEKLGHTVVPIQENNSNCGAVLQEIKNCDMLYWTHTHSFKLDSYEHIIEMLRIFKQNNIPSVGYHLDLWMGLEREKDLHKDPYWNIEHFFTVDFLMAEYLNSNTKTKGYYLPPGCFEDESYAAEPNLKKYPHEIIFTGSKQYHKEHPYRAQLINWLHNNYGERFAHYGGGGLPSLRGHELNVLYSSAKIAIGDTLCKDFNYPWYFSDRCVEQPSRNAFQIFPYIRGLELMFDIGIEIVTYKFNDFIELKSKIDFYLANDEQREKIRTAGHKRAKQSHSYTKRLEFIIEKIFP